LKKDGKWRRKFPYHLKYTEIVFPCEGKIAYFGFNSNDVRTKILNR
tara:strand:+ start:22689 stop:22826 length:138 start_codon:yes stop_codon:yes gene_type:complete